MVKATSQKSDDLSDVTLDSVMQEFQYWRNNKHEHGKKSIPDLLWLKSFYLAEKHSGKTIRKMFSLNSQQYKIKYKQLYQAEAKQASLEGTAPRAISTPAAPSDFCEVIHESPAPSTDVPPLTHKPHTTPETLAKIKSTNNNPESFLDLTTIIIECIHPNGHRLKIHATQQSLSEVMKTFYQVEGISA